MPSGSWATSRKAPRLDAVALILWRMMGAPSPIDAHRLDSRLVWARGQSGDAREGVQSFIDKRPAVFADRVSTDLPHFSPWLDELAWNEKA